MKAKAITDLTHKEMPGQSREIMTGWIADYMGGRIARIACQVTVITPIYVRYRSTVAMEMNRVSTK